MVILIVFVSFIVLIGLISVFGEKYKNKSDINILSEYLLKELEPISYINRDKLYKPNCVKVIDNIDFDNIVRLQMHVRKNTVIYKEFREFLVYCIRLNQYLKGFEDECIVEERFKDLVHKIESYKYCLKKSKKSNTRIQIFILIVASLATFVFLLFIEVIFRLDDTFYKDLAMLNATFSIGVGTLLLTVSSISGKKDIIFKHEIIKFVSLEFPLYFLVNIILLIIPSVRMPDTPNLEVFKILKILMGTVGVLCTAFIIFKVKSLFTKFLIDKIFIRK